MPTFFNFDDIAGAVQMGTDGTDNIKLSEHPGRTRAKGLGDDDHIQGTDEATPKLPHD